VIGLIDEKLPDRPILDHAPTFMELHSTEIFSAIAFIILIIVPLFLLFRYRNKLKIDFHLKNPFSDWDPGEILSLIFGLASFCIVLFAAENLFEKITMLALGVFFIGQTGHRRGWWEH